MLSGGIVVGVFDDAFTNFKTEVESGEGDVAALEVFHDAQGVQVVVKAESVGLHGFVEGTFASVAEGRVAEVVGQGEGFHQIGIELQFVGDGARDLADFQSVGEAVAKVVGVAAREDLRLRFQTAEGAGMNNAVAVALKVVPVGMRRFGIAASAGVFCADGVVGELGVGSQLPAPSSQFTACG